MTGLTVLDVNIKIAGVSMDESSRSNHMPAPVPDSPDMGAGEFYTF